MTKREIAKIEDRYVQLLHELKKITNDYECQVDVHKKNVLYRDYLEKCGAFREIAKIYLWVKYGEEL